MTIPHVLRAAAERIDLTREITDDFCSAFDDEKYDGAFARIIASGVRPEGVDENDPRVIEIVRKCREALRVEDSP